MALHPLHPDSPEYPEMVEAGRAPAGGYAWPLADPTLCRDDDLGHDDGRECGKPVVANVVRTDGAGPVIGKCFDHAQAYTTPASREAVWIGLSFDVSWVGACSVCAKPAKAYELDSAGRCDACAS